jgi:hypothetical protein
MAIKEILGADDFPLAARWPTWLLLGKGVAPSVNQGLTSANTGATAYNGRTWMKVTGNANPGLTALLSDLKFSVAEMKAKKIWLGFRHVIGSNAAVTGAVPILGVQTIGAAGTFNVVLESDLQRATDEVFVECLIDLAAGKIDGYIDGALVRSVATTSLTVANLTNIRLFYGMSSGAVVSELHLYNDFYWLVDSSDVDQLPSNRLGPIKVKTAKVAGSVLPSDWTVPDGQTADGILDASTMAPNTELTPVIRTSPAESPASIGFAKPAAELAIKAVSIEVFGYRDTGTAPTLQAQLKQGAKTDTKKTFTTPTLDYNRGAASDRLGCFNVDLNGAAWTNDSIDSLEVLINSKTGA